MKTYAQTGVSRKLRKKAKKSLKGFEATFDLSKHGKIIKTPFNLLYPAGRGIYQVKTCDGVGTKVLLAQLAGRHDTVGIDAVAMVVNDCIRSGAGPIAITDMIDIKKSEPELLKEIQRGLITGAKEAGCPFVGGETADVPELLSVPYHINCDCVGEVRKRDVITGKGIRAGDAVIGFRSSGIHSNGLTLARKVLFKKWGGKFGSFEKPGGLRTPLVYECLKPTKIYVKSFMKIAEKFRILGAVNVTGDAYLKFKNLANGRIGFELDNFKPQPVFGLIQKAGNVSDKEMFQTFNMGWGFAIIVRNKDAGAVLGLLRKEKTEADVIGRVIGKNKVIIKHKDKKITL